jgi:hypothetical protein
MGENVALALLEDAEDLLDVVDVVTTPIGVIRAARRRLAKRSNTTRLQEAMQVELRSFRARRDQETERRLAELEASEPDRNAFLARVAAMADDVQYHRLQRNLEWEAIRETLHERKELLAHAAGGLSTPALTINEKARVERALRQVDAEDVIRLDRLARFDDPAFAPAKGNPSTLEQQREFHNARKRLQQISQTPLARSSLTMAGCISEDGGMYGGPILVITSLGRQLLDVLESYLSEKRHA